MSVPDLPDVLGHGRLEVLGRLTDASNITLLGQLELSGVTLRCIYKPIRGERPLWDFPDGTLAQREVAAHAVSAAAGWHCVPPTVLRPGPLGEGMVQQWIGPDPLLDVGTDPDDAADPADDLVSPDDDEADEHQPGGATGIADLVDLVPADRVPAGWRPVFRALDTDGTLLALCHADDPRLAQIAGFDLVVNNADRKAPHLLTTPDRRVLGVDHGLTFHVDDKLRTILWGWAGESLGEPVVAGLHRLAGWLDRTEELDPLLTVAEIRRLRARVAQLLADPVFPAAPDDRTPIPWPPL